MPVWNPKKVGGNEVNDTSGNGFGCHMFGSIVPYKHGSCKGTDNSHLALSQFVGTVLPKVYSVQFYESCYAGLIAFGFSITI